MFSELTGTFKDLVILWLVIMAAVTLLCFVVSEITRNYSQVDKLWSLMPIVYSWVTVATFSSARLMVMASLVTLWGLRLSYNFHRKGGYSLIPWKGAEDYRWQIIRNLPVFKGRFMFGIFNLFFISFYQNLLILLFSSPLLLAVLHPEKPLTLLDLMAAVLMLIFILTESIADSQQFWFHKEKNSPQSAECRYRESLKKGFLAEGLWRHSRHPNFASEQGIWISFYLFSVAASGQWINYTLAGSFLLVLLFIGSTKLTESISRKKYPAYAAYQQEVPKFIPRVRGFFSNSSKTISRG